MIRPSRASTQSSSQCRRTRPFRLTHTTTIGRPTVVSGTWQFGYGDRFDEHALKRLPPGSVYSEPGAVNHFARTGSEPVLMQITGVGPHTDCWRESHFFAAVAELHSAPRLSHSGYRATIWS